MELHLFELLREMMAVLAEKILARKKIYLDTNHWVELRKVVLGASSKKPIYEEILELLRRLVADGHVCCPVSSTIFDELMKQTDVTTRTASARLMDELSWGICLRFFHCLAREEWRYHVHNAVSRAGWPSYRLESRKVRYPVWTKAGFWANQEDLLFDDAFLSGRSKDEILSWIEFHWNTGFEQATSMPGYQAVPPGHIRNVLAACNDPHERFHCRSASFEEVKQSGKLQLLESLKVDLFRVPLPIGIAELPISIFESFVDGDDPWILPSVQVYAALGAAIFQSARRVRDTDPWDFDHAATAIPYVDTYCCDNSAAALLRGAPLRFDKVYDTVILSRPDEIRDYLCEL